MHQGRGGDGTSQKVWWNRLEREVGLLGQVLLIETLVTRAGKRRGVGMEDAPEGEFVKDGW